MDELNERVRALEVKAEHQDAKLDVVITTMNTNSKVLEKHNQIIANQKGMARGVILATSLFWAAIIAILSYFK